MPRSLRITAAGCCWRFARAAAFNSCCRCNDSTLALVSPCCSSSSYRCCCAWLTAGGGGAAAAADSLPQHKCAAVGIWQPQRLPALQDLGQDKQGNTRRGSPVTNTADDDGQGSSPSHAPLRPTIKQAPTCACSSCRGVLSAISGARSACLPLMWRCSSWHAGVAASSCRLSLRPGDSGSVRGSSCSSLHSDSMSSGACCCLSPPLLLQSLPARAAAAGAAAVVAAAAAERAASRSSDSSSMRSCSASACRTQSNQ